MVLAQEPRGCSNEAYLEMQRVFAEAGGVPAAEACVQATSLAAVRAQRLDSKHH